jgi:anti-anti-sigma factor
MELARVHGRPLASCFVVQIEGEIDASNASEVTDRIGEMAEGGAAGLIVDLSQTEYLDSAGIRMLFTLQSRLESVGRAMAIAIPEQSPAQQVLTIAEVSQLIPVVDSVDGALRLIDRKGPKEGA